MCDYDIELDQIVDDVEDMYREHQQNQSPHQENTLSSLEQQQHQQANMNVLAKNLLSSSVTTSMTSMNTQEIADEIAKSLVEKALDQDRIKVIKNRNDPETDFESVCDTYAEVAVSRALDSVINRLVDEAVIDVTNQVNHGCGGQLEQLNGAAYHESTESLLKKELAEFMAEIMDTLPEKETPLSFGLFRPLKNRTVTDSDYYVNEGTNEIESQPQINCKGNNSNTADAANAIAPGNKSSQEGKIEKTSPSINGDLQQGKKALSAKPVYITAKKRREADRRKRNSAGLLLSSLKRKVYHCRCIDCQAERRAEGKPEPSTSIELRDVELPTEIPKDISIPRVRGRGRPRIFPRVEDLFSGEKKGPDSKKLLRPEQLMQQQQQSVFLEKTNSNESVAKFPEGDSLTQTEKASVEGQEEIASSSPSLSSPEGATRPTFLAVKTGGVAAAATSTSKEEGQPTAVGYTTEDDMGDNSSSTASSGGLCGQESPNLEKGGNIEEEEEEREKEGERQQKASEKEREKDGGKDVCSVSIIYEEDKGKSRRKEREEEEEEEREELYTESDETASSLNFCFSDGEEQEEEEQTINSPPLQQKGNPEAQQGVDEKQQFPLKLLLQQKHGDDSPANNNNKKEENPSSYSGRGGCCSSSIRSQIGSSEHELEWPFSMVDDEPDSEAAMTGSASASSPPSVETQDEEECAGETENSLNKYNSSRCSSGNSSSSSSMTNMGVVVREEEATVSHGAVRERRINSVEEREEKTSFSSSSSSPASMEENVDALAFLRVNELEGNNTTSLIPLTKINVSSRSNNRDTSTGSSSTFMGAGGRGGEGTLCQDNKGKGNNYQRRRKEAEINCCSEEGGVNSSTNGDTTEEVGEEGQKQWKANNNNSNSKKDMVFLDEVIQDGASDGNLIGKEATRPQRDGGDKEELIYPAENHLEPVEELTSIGKGGHHHPSVSGLSNLCKLEGKAAAADQAATTATTAFFQQSSFPVKMMPQATILSSPATTASTTTSATTATCTSSTSGKKGAKLRNNLGEFSALSSSLKGESFFSGSQTRKGAEKEEEGEDEMKLMRQELKAGGSIGRRKAIAYRRVIEAERLTRNLKEPASDAAATATNALEKGGKGFQEKRQGERVQHDAQVKLAGKNAVTTGNPAAAAADKIDLKKKKRKNLLMKARRKGGGEEKEECKIPGGNVKCSFLLLSSTDFMSSSSKKGSGEGGEVEKGLKPESCDGDDGGVDCDSFPSSCCCGCCQRCLQASQTRKRSADICKPQSAKSSSTSSPSFSSPSSSFGCGFQKGNESALSNISSSVLLQRETTASASPFKSDITQGAEIGGTIQSSKSKIAAKGKRRRSGKVIQESFLETGKASPSRRLSEDGMVCKEVVKKVICPIDNLSTIPTREENGIGKKLDKGCFEVKKNPLLYLDEGERTMELRGEEGEIREKKEEIALLHQDKRKGTVLSRRGRKMKKKKKKKKNNNNGHERNLSTSLPPPAPQGFICNADSNREAVTSCKEKGAFQGTRQQHQQQHQQLQQGQQVIPGNIEAQKEQIPLLKDLFPFDQKEKASFSPSHHQDSKHEEKTFLQAIGEKVGSIIEVDHGKEWVTGSTAETTTTPASQKHVVLASMEEKEASSSTDREKVHCLGSHCNTELDRSPTTTLQDSCSSSQASLRRSFCSRKSSVKVMRKKLGLQSHDQHYLTSPSHSPSSQNRLQQQQKLIKEESCQAAATVANAPNKPLADNSSNPQVRASSQTSMGKRKHHYLLTDLKESAELLGHSEAIATKKEEEEDKELKGMNASPSTSSNHHLISHCSTGMGKKCESSERGQKSELILPLPPGMSKSISQLLRREKSSLLWQEDNDDNSRGPSLYARRRKRKDRQKEENEEISSLSSSSSSPSIFKTFRSSSSEREKGLERKRMRLDEKGGEGEVEEKVGKKLQLERSGSSTTNLPSRRRSETNVRMQECRREAPGTAAAVSTEVRKKGKSSLQQQQVEVENKQELLYSSSSSVNAEEPSFSTPSHFISSPAGYAVVTEIEQEGGEARERRGISDRKNRQHVKQQGTLFKMQDCYVRLTDIRCKLSLPALGNIPCQNSSFSLVIPSDGKERRKMRQRRKSQQVLFEKGEKNKRMILNSQDERKKDKRNAKQRKWNYTSADRNSFHSQASSVDAGGQRAAVNEQDSNRNSKRNGSHIPEANETLETRPKQLGRTKKQQQLLMSHPPQLIIQEERQQKQTQKMSGQWGEGSMEKNTRKGGNQSCLTVTARSNVYVREGRPVVYSLGTEDQQKRGKFFSSFQSTICHDSPGGHLKDEGRYGSKEEVTRQDMPKETSHEMWQTPGEEKARSFACNTNGTYAHTMPETWNRCQQQHVSGPFADVEDAVLEDEFFGSNQPAFTTTKKKLQLSPSHFIVPPPAYFNYNSMASRESMGAVHFKFSSPFEGKSNLASSRLHQHGGSGNLFQRPGERNEFDEKDEMDEVC